MSWHKDRQREPETEESTGQLRDQLVAACQNVRRQMELQQHVQFLYSHGGGHDGDAIALRLLQTELDQLEEALANLGPDDA